MTVSERGARLRQQLRRELGSWQPRLSVCLGLANALPQYAFGSARIALLRAAGLSIGHGSAFGGRIRVAGGHRPGARLRIGERCFVNDGCRFDVSSPVTLGDDVYVGHDVAFITATHEMGDGQRRAGANSSAPITVGARTWVGARASVLTGVTIGEGAVIGAGSVVTKDVAADVVVAGVPAVVLRRLDEHDRAGTFD